MSKRTAVIETLESILQQAQESKRSIAKVYQEDIPRYGTEHIDVELFLERLEDDPAWKALIDLETSLNHALKAISNLSDMAPEYALDRSEPLSERKND